MNELKVMIFGGTTEGRLLAGLCLDNGIHCEVSVTTDYGASLLPQGIPVHTGKLDCAQMRELLARCGCNFAVDATHPYAKEATANIRAACTAADIPYRRLLREDAEVRGVSAENMKQLTEILNSHNGNILCTLGSKALPELAAVKNARERIWVRVLPAEGIKEYCEGLGFDREKVICGKGPFSVEENLRHLEMCKAEILVTKESGATGGYPEKAEAAERYGAILLTLVREREEGLAFDDITKELLRQRDMMR